MKSTALFVLLIGCICFSCTEYTPKPKGYFRIEPEPHRYHSISGDNLFFNFKASDLAKISYSPITDSVMWVSLHYPRFKATIYCNYIPLSEITLEEAIGECRFLAERQAVAKGEIREKLYTNASSRVYGSLFLLDGAVTPIQFMLTDSVNHFLRGALYYECPLNTDSLSPVTIYLEQDIMELIQSFNWKE